MINSNIIIKYLIEKINNIQLPLENIEGIYGFYRVNNLYIKNSTLYINYKSNERSIISEDTAQTINHKFLNNIFFAVLKQIEKIKPKDIWND